MLLRWGREDSPRRGVHQPGVLESSPSPVGGGPGSPVLTSARSGGRGPIPGRCPLPAAPALYAPGRALIGPAASRDVSLTPQELSEPPRTPPSPGLPPRLGCGTPRASPEGTQRGGRGEARGGSWGPGRSWLGVRRCRCRPWVAARGGHRVRRGRDVWANPHRPGHSSHATGRILKAPIPRPAAPRDPPGGRPVALLPPRPRGFHKPTPAPSASVPVAPGHPRCPEPRGQRGRGKTAPGSAVRARSGGLGCSGPAGAPRTRGDERGRPRRGLKERAPPRGRARPAAGVPGTAQRRPPAPCVPPTHRAAGPPHSSAGSPWGRGRRGSRGGHGPGCPGPVKDCPGSREKPPCPLSPLSPGDRATRGASWGWDGAEGASGGRGAMFGVRGGARAELAAPSPGPRGVTGQVLPCREDKGDQPAPKICPLRPQPRSQPSCHEVGDRPGGPALPGGVPGVALGTSRAKGLRPDPGGPPRSLAVTLRVGGGGNGF